jgi:hypothetical protein
MAEGRLSEQQSEIRNRAASSRAPRQPIARRAGMIHARIVRAVVVPVADDRCVVRAAKTLNTLPAIKTLHLTGTNITDAAIPDLASLRRLSKLFIRWTKISDAGARNLAAALPNCAIHHHALVE